MNYTEEILTNFNEIKPNYLDFSLSVVKHLNIRSLRKCFLTFLANINSIINKIQIIILCETNIADEENELYSIDGFNSIFLNREGKGSGIAIYIRDHMQYETMNINMISAEILQVEIQYVTHNTLTVFPTYRTPNKSISQFLNEIEQILYHVSKINKIILIGDINIDIQKTNTNTTKYLSILSSNGLKSLVNNATREGSGSKTCIDHFFIRWDKKLKEAYAAVVTTDISDHHAIFGSIAEIGHKTKENIQSDIEYKINNNKVNNGIIKVNWQELINKSTNTNELFCNINNTSKNRHIYQQFFNNKNNIRGTWKIINEVIGKKN